MDLTMLRAAKTVVLACAVACLAFQSTEEALLSRVRAGVDENLRRMPRYTCVQTVNRTRYAQPAIPRDCADALTLRPKQVAIWRDRLRLDVAVGSSTDMYSWAGASRFDNDEVRQLAARGMSASGEFSGLLTGVFGGDAGDFRYLGDESTPAGKMPSFGFATPLARSHYSYHTASGQMIVGYQGRFVADPASGDLKRLSVEAGNLPANVCHITSEVEYEKFRIGAGDFVLPASSTVAVLYQDGTESRNETTYSGCREYAGDSTIHFETEDAPVLAGGSKTSANSLPPLPPRTRLRVRVDPQLDGRTAAAGDPITGVIDAPVRQQGRLLVAAGDKLHGRILRMEQTLPHTANTLSSRPPTAEQMRMSAMCPQCLPQTIEAQASWVVAIVFDTLERAGAQEKVALKAVDDGFRFEGPHGQIAGSDRPPGGGIFVFGGGTLVLGQKFESTWEIQ
jgi:hypothetical protein